MSTTKRIEIVETDLKYRTGLAEILMREGAVAIVFEVPLDFDVTSYEGLADFKPEMKTVESFNSKFPEIAAWLENYSGTFDFYLSLKHQFKAKGMLSEKQIVAVQRAIEKDKAFGKVTPEGIKREFSLKAGTIVVLSKFIGNKIAEQSGHARAHRAFEIVDVEGETEKAYRARVRLSARRTSYCGVCGLVLENPISVAAGIGPVCAENNGIPYGEKSLDELHAKLNTTVEVTTWIPKASIKERIEAA